MILEIQIAKIGAEAKHPK